MQTRRPFYKYLPNVISIINLTIGAVSISMIIQDYLLTASVLIVIAALLDFLDGFLARLLNACSVLGKQLDTIADLTSFGVAPALILYKILNIKLGILVFTFYQTSFSGGIVPYPEAIKPVIESLFILIIIFSGIRLAVFNADESTGSSRTFKGLPTPANALFFASLPVIFFYYEDNLIQEMLTNVYFLMGATIVHSILMVSRIPMFSLKFKGALFRNNKLAYLLIAGSVILIIFFQLIAVPLIIYYYILLSLFNRWIYKIE